MTEGPSGIQRENSVLSGGEGEERLLGADDLHTLWGKVEALMRQMARKHWGTNYCRSKGRNEQKHRALKEPKMFKEMQALA